MQRPLANNANNCALVYDAIQQKWLLFTKALAVYTSYQSQDIPSILKDIERQSAEEELYAVGFLAYEAASAFDNAFPSPRPGSPAFPLLYFAMYSKAEEFSESIFQEEAKSERDSVLAWEPSLSESEYKDAFQKIKNYIALGQSYQVNYSFRLRALFDPESFDTWALFRQMIYAQTGVSYKGVYGAYIETEDWVICSASPELFFKLEKNELVSQPMKGTISRGLHFAEDCSQAERLRASPKDRAENSMIVDMLRNDLGRIASLGKVSLGKLFHLERYPSLWQMISEVRCCTEAGLFAILSALFPAASITGAPKKATMEIINELEKDRRDVYTGTIGFWGPGRRAQFNVAIRTAWIHKQTGEARYGIGSAIVWDSDAKLEWKECGIKSAILKPELSKPAFSLLETILWDPQEGYFLLESHLKRLAESASYFDYQIDLQKIKKELSQAAKKMGACAHKLRLLVTAHGSLSLESEPLAPGLQNYPVCLAKTPVDFRNPLLYHKTSWRKVYTEAIEACPGCEDVLLWNERGELTESSIANVLVQIEGDLFTPPLSCGLLGGTYRALLLAQNKIKERIIPIKELEHCQKIYLINSVRKLWEIQLESGLIN